MTARTTRIAAVGAGALLALGISTIPAHASDGAQADAHASASGAGVSAATADVVSQTLAVVNKACADAANVSGAATSALGAGTGTGISVASQGAGSGLNLSVSLPALSSTVSGLGSLPLVGSLAGHLDTDTPLKVSCAASDGGTGLGLSGAGVDALVNAIAPGLDLSQIDLPAGLSLSGDANASTPAASAGAGSAPATGQAAVTTRAAAAAPSAPASAAQPRTATATGTLTATPASSSGGIVAQTIGSPGALARTGAGVSLLALLGTALFGSGRLLAFSRKLLRHAG